MSARSQNETLSSPPSPLRALPNEVVRQLARYELLRPYVNKKLLDSTLQGVEISAEESQQLLKQFCKKKGFNSKDAFQQFLQQEGINEETMAWRLSLPLRIERYSSDRFGGKAEQRFLERKEQLDSVMYSLLRVKDPYLALELYMRIAEGEASFAELASDFSEGSEKNNGGSVGPVPLRQAHPQLSEALRTNAPGVLIEPFRIDEWWLVVRLNRYTPAVFDEKTRKRMSAELFQRWLDEQITEQIKQLSSTLSA